MLGYVRAVASELRVREHEMYRAVYCGLCKSMGKCTGQCSRMTLSYDFVFLAAVRMSLLGETVTVEKKRCIAHWLRPRSTVTGSPTLDYCADASALLTYHKLLDDCKDECGARRAVPFLLRPFLSHGYRRAKRRYPLLNEKISDLLAQLHAYEQSTTATESADAPSELFGMLMEAVFSEGLEGSEARLSGAIGRVIGRWIYLVDAADDLAEDVKRHRFNPYRGLFGEALSEEEKEIIRTSLTVLLADAERAFLLIDEYPAPELREILANILYLGLPTTVRRVLRDGTERKP